MNPVRKQSERALIASLHRRLTAAADAKTRGFWERYLKGVIPFRGVPMAKVRVAVNHWFARDGVAALPLAQRKRLALALFTGEHCEDKLAGMLALSEHLLPHLRIADLKALGRLFEANHVADWNTCDWFCVKVLGRFVARDLPDPTAAEAIAGWKHARTLWQRRASNVAFVYLARNGDRNFPGFVQLMLDTCATTVQCPERFAQTGVGWLLRELSLADRPRVAAFAEKHVRQLSREGMRYLVEKMPAADAGDLLRLHAAGSRTSAPDEQVPRTGGRARRGNLGDKHGSI
ncbi:MAG: DNA alkylation repair protein [Lentisphaerae bacterium]|nr:DNA alkylation repair protein [Lentisphaerota bacterium]